MEETYLLKHPGVKKKILAGGTGPLPHFPPGTKIVFHFQTLKDNFERTVIDDSRLAKRPAEIFVGKLFKMEVWEVLLMSMRVGEVAEFWCDAMHTGLYPMVSKGMRLIAQGKDPLEGQRHMCGMGNMFNYSSTGWPELDELMREPQALIFIMELIQVGDPMSYKRESWMMEKDEKLKEVPSLHMQGNALVRQGRFREASARYQEAVLLLRTVKSREMPGDEDYINLSRLIIPLVLNYCQCMLELNEFYEVILHTSELLEKHKDCVKAYYKRAKAYAAVWDEKEARKDFNMVANLDSSLAPLIRKELKNLSERMKEKYWEEKESYWNILETEKKEEEEEEDVEEKEEEEEEEGKRSEDREPAEEEESTATVVEEELQSKESQQEVKQAVQAETKVANEEEGNSADAKTETNQSSPSVTEGKDWQQMLRLVMFLQDEGNFRFKEHRYEEASGKFKEALEYVDFLQTKEVKYKGEDWESLEKVRLPLTLNLSQCLLELQDFQRVVELNDKLLKRNRGNIKALYQRARAHSALCNEEDARRDYAKVERLDPKFKPIVRQEMKRLGENIRAMHVRQKKNYWESSREKWGPGGGKAGRNKATKEVEGAKVEKKKKVGREEGAGGKSVTESAGNAVKEDEAEVKKTEGTSEEGKTKVTKVKFREGVKEGKEKCGEEKAESVAVLGETETEPDNRGAHEDTQPAADTAARDNVATRRSGADKKKTKVKCQSSAAQGNVKERPGNKGTNDKTESGSSVQSGSTKRSQLSGTNLHSAEVAGERERSVTQTNPSKAEEEEMRCVDGGKEREGDNLDEQHSEATGDKTEPEIQTQNRKNDSAAKKSKRKQKKKK